MNPGSKTLSPLRMIAALCGGFFGGIVCVIAGIWLVVAANSTRPVFGGALLITGGMIFAGYSLFIYVVSVRRK